MNAKVEMKKARKPVKKTNTGRVSRARKTTKDPVKIYSYHAVLTEEDLKLARQLLWEANCYYNDSVAIENARREAFRAMRAEHCPWLAENEPIEIMLSDRLDELRSEINRQRATSRSNIASDVLLDEARRVKQDLKALRLVGAKERKAANAMPQVREKAAAIDALGRELKNNLNRHTKLHWSTKGIQDTAVKQAMDTSPWRVSFKRFAGRGRLGGQIRGRGVGEARNLTSEDLFIDRSTQIRISPLPAGQWDTRPGRRHAYTRVKFLVDRRDAPVYLEFSILMNRPLPEGALIKNAWLLFDGTGDKSEVKFQLTVESSSFSREKKSREPVAVWVCYRNTDAGAHVATAVSLGGQVSHLVIPEHAPRKLKGGGSKQRLGICLRDSLKKADDLRSIADDRINEVKEVAISMMDDGSLPSRLDSFCEHLAKWRSPRRFYALAHKLGDPFNMRALWQRWVRIRRSRGEDLYAPFERIMASDFGESEEERAAFYFQIWMKKDKHLREWEARTRKSVNRRRKAIFTDFVNKFRDHDVIMGEYNFKETTTKLEAENDGHATPLRFFRSLCSPGVLAALFKEKGATLVKAKGLEGEQLGEVNHATARCIALLRHEGFDTSRIEEKLKHQRDALDSLRDENPFV